MYTKKFASGTHEENFSHDFCIFGLTKASIKTIGDRLQSFFLFEYLIIVFTALCIQQTLAYMERMKKNKKKLIDRVS